MRHRGALLLVAAGMILSGCGSGPEPEDPPPVEVEGTGISQVRIKREDVREWQEKQQRPPTGEGNFYLGYRAYHEGRFEEAIAYYQRAVEINPDFALAWGHLGATQYRLKRFAEAEESLRRAIQVDEKYANAYYNLALVLDQLGKRREALRSCRRAVELDPNDFQAARMFRHLKQKLDKSP